MKHERSASRRGLREQLTTSRRRAFWIATIAFPFVALIALEAGLRVFDYGPDLSLLMKCELNGRTYHIMNPGVRHRYFSRLAVSPSTSPDYFINPKPKGVFRIFCLGGSTTVGFPYWYNASFSSFLRDRLQKTFPERSIEVINLGMTATNSYAVLDMAADLPTCEPDLLIVYDGHNEFYGALGASSRDSFGGSRWLSRLSLKLVHIRIYQLALNIASGFEAIFGGEGSPLDRGTMMERLAKGRTVPHDSQTYRDCLESFRANLHDLRELCARKGIPLILCTQVSNLRSQIPFVSELPVGVTPTRRLNFDLHFNAGLQHQLIGDFVSALAEFKEARTLLSDHAELHYRIAQCLDTLGSSAEALPEFTAARDLDELRFRASSDFNTAIRTAEDGATCYCADVEAAFAAASPNGIVGNNLILEHLHPKAYGNFLIARALCQTMRTHGLLVDPDHWAAADTLSDETLWNIRSLTDLDQRIATRRVEALTTAWPFQPTEIPLSEVSGSDPIGEIADRFARGEAHWKQAHDSAAAHYALAGNITALEREYRTIINQLPLVDSAPYLKLARLLVNQHRISESHAVLHGALAIWPEDRDIAQLLLQTDSLSR